MKKAKPTKKGIAAIRDWRDRYRSAMAQLDAAIAITGSVSGQIAGDVKRVVQQGLPPTSTFSRTVGLELRAATKELKRARRSMALVVEMADEKVQELLIEARR